MDNYQVVPPPPPGFILIGQTPEPPPGFVMSEKIPEPPVGFQLISNQEEIRPSVQTDKPTFWQSLKRDMIDKLYGTVEAGANIGTGILSLLPATGAAVGKLLSGSWEGPQVFPEALQLFEKVSSGLTIKPKQEFGKLVSDVAFAPIRPIQEAIGRVAEEVPAQYMPLPMTEEQKTAAINLFGNLGLLAVFPKLSGMAKGYLNKIFVEGRPILGRNLKMVMKDVPELSEQIRQNIESIPDDQIIYQEKLATAEKISARKPEEIQTFAEMPRARVTQPEEMAAGEEIRIGRDLDTGELVIKMPPKPITKIPEKVSAPKGKLKYMPAGVVSTKQYQGIPVEKLTGLAKFQHEEKMGGAEKPKPSVGLPKGLRKPLGEEYYVRKDAANAAIRGIESGETKWEELDPVEIELIKEYYGQDKLNELERKAKTEIVPPIPEEMVKLKEAADKEWEESKRIRYQGLPEKLTISPEWKPEYDDLIIPALEKANIPRERWNDATLLLKHSFSMEKTKAKMPADAMLYYLRAKRFRERIAKPYYVGGEGPETLFTEVAKPGEEGRIERQLTKEQLPGAIAERKGKLPEEIEDIETRENNLEIMGQLTKKIYDDYEKTITEPRAREVFHQYRTLPENVSYREREATLKKAGISLTDNTIKKLSQKFDKEVGEIAQKRKTELQEIFRQTEETQKIIDEEFEKPEGRVKSGGTIPRTIDLPKYAGSVNLERIDEIPEIKDIILKTSERWGDFEKTRRKGMTLVETERLADAIGKTPEEMAHIIKSKTRELPEYMTHFRDFLATAADNVRKVAIENKVNPTEEGMAKFGLALKRFERLLGTEEAGASEIGRGLSAFRILSKSKEFLALKNYKAILKMLGPEGKSQDIMRLIGTLDPNDPLAVAKFLRQAITATTKDKLFEIWVNSILSNPKTWIRNAVSNALVAPAMPLTRAISSLAELRRGKAREVYLGEAPMMMWSIKDGIQDGFRRAAFAWNNELTMANMSKIETARYGAIKGKAGKIIRIPGRILIATDEFFKGALRMADIYALSYRSAIKEGKRGVEAIGKRMTELIKNPTEEMESHATGEALYYTFQKQLGKYGKSIAKIREEHALFKYIVPFLRTPINIAKFGIEHTPLKLIEIIYKGLTGKLKGAAMSNEIGKAGLGVMAVASLVSAILDGHITGSAPVNPNERAAFLRQGKREYSIKIGDSWYGYGYLEPAGTSVGIISDFILLMDKASEQEKSQIAGKILTSFYKNMSSKTFNSGVINFIDTIRDPGRFLPKFVKGLAGSVVPSALAGVATAVDPEMRDARTILDRIKSRVPGISKELPPRRDIWGAAQEKTSTAITRLVSPVDVSKEKNDTVENELSRLKIYPGMPDKKIRNRELSAKQYDYYVKYAGELSHSWLYDLIKDQFYKDLPDEVKDKLIRGKLSAARAFVRNELFANILAEENR